MVDTAKTNRIKEMCLASTTTDPILLAIEMMKDPLISIHGPEHHILDGAALLSAIYHSGVHFDLEAALDQIIERGNQMPGAICGNWGVCGSAASVGAALAILHHTGPLSDNEDYKMNLELTSQALSKIAKIGGPRCCKRNAYLSLSTAIELLHKYQIHLDNHPTQCEFSSKNKQCIHEKCPFYPHP